MLMLKAEAKVIPSVARANRDLIGWDHGIVAAETSVAILRLCNVTVCAADRAIEPIERNEFQTVYGQMLAHFLF